MPDNRKFVQSQYFVLAGAGVTIGATTMVLSSFADPDGNLLTMTSFGTKGFMTLDPNNSSQEEPISFTGVTQNANGTATLTGISNMGFTSPYTETSGFLKSHAGGTKVIITNTAGFYDSFANKENDETINGTYIFNSDPQSTTDPVSGNDLTRRSWVLSQINGGAVSTDKVIVLATAGETVVAGNLVYLKTADGFWWKADASTIATVDKVIFGIAQGAGTASNTITNGVLIHGVDPNQSGMTIGNIMYATNTPGTISSTPGTRKRAIGVAKSATNLYFDPNFQGYASRYDIQTQSYVYQTTSVGTDSYAVTLDPAPAALTAGMRVQFKADVANTGAATLAVNGLAATAIKKNVSDALADSDIKASQVVDVTFDGTNFQMLPLAGASGFTVLGDTTLGGSATTIDITGFAARAFLIVHLQVSTFGTADQVAVKFNNDGGTNYSVRLNTNTGGDGSPAVSQTSGLLEGTTSAGPHIVTLTIANRATSNKMFTTVAINGTNAGTAPNRSEGGGIWANATDQVTRITFSGLNGFSFGAGTRMIVYGSQN